MDAADDPALTMTDGTPQEVEAVRSDPLAGVMPQPTSAARRRGQAILASAAAAAVVLALLAYVVDQQRPHTSLTQKELRDIVANGTTTPSRPPTVNPLRGAAGSVTPESSLQAPALASAPDLAGRGNSTEPSTAKAPQDRDPRSGGGVADEVPAPAGAAPKRVLPVTPAPTGTPTSSCSGPALALGLCDVNPSSTPRQ
jgi:hypothetical protein